MRANSIVADDYKVVVTVKLTDPLLNYLTHGGRVLLLTDGVLKDYRPGAEVRPGDKIATVWPDGTQTSLFRTPSWGVGTHGNNGTVIADHPALAGFPHSGWCNLQFFHLIAAAHPIVLEHYRPLRIEPIIRSIGHAGTMIDKTYLFEVGVGKGSLLATCLRIPATYETHSESKWLLECLLKYAVGEQFAPKTRVSREVFVSTLRKP